ncbi:MAG TPA: trehalase family glycosidase [Polyangia bacterium]
MRRRRAPSLAPLLAALSAVACARARPPTTAATPADPLAPARVTRLRDFIHATWPALTRTPADLPTAARDDKIPHVAGAPWPVYLPSDDDPAAIAAGLTRVLPPGGFAKVLLRPLPPAGRPIAEPGLLYLPRPYVVPGGRFNEMYGWDSAFIVIGLLRDGETALARDVVDNQLYEVRHYGGVLNANRTYYLTRSQPPLLSEMVLAVYRAAGDRNWLAGAREALEATHAHWTSPPHLVPDFGLSRYFDHGQGPAQEVETSERDAAGQTHYDRVRAFFRAHPDPAYARFYDRAVGRLTPAFFEGDRAMRESGFDPTGRFGPFGAEAARTLPVCLNTLLYRFELDLAEIDRLLGRTAEAARFVALAGERQRRVEGLLWDEERGLYFDYDLDARRLRPYPFATTFWPLWAGLASTPHARRVIGNLALFERPGGIRTSTVVTGAQWDAPFGWAPLQLFAVEGLRRAGDVADADRIAREFLSMLIEDFERRGTLVEKYDVERRTSDLGDALRFGYPSNEVGFGWTNGVALELLATLGR